jgi:hypothetical protein
MQRRGRTRGKNTARQSNAYCKGCITVNGIAGIKPGLHHFPALRTRSVIAAVIDVLFDRADALEPKKKP